jgi:hypothetical protein
MPLLVSRKEVLLGTGRVKEQRRGAAARRREGSMALAAVSHNQIEIKRIVYFVIKEHCWFFQYDRLSVFL